MAARDAPAANTTFISFGSDVVSIVTAPPAGNSWRRAAITIPAVRAIPEARSSGAVGRDHAWPLRRAEGLPVSSSGIIQETFASGIGAPSGYRRSVDLGAAPELDDQARLDPPGEISAEGNFGTIRRGRRIVRKWRDFVRRKITRGLSARAVTFPAPIAWNSNEPSEPGVSRPASVAAGSRARGSR